MSPPVKDEVFVATFCEGDEIIYSVVGASKKHAASFRGVVLKVYDRHVRVLLYTPDGNSVEKVVRPKTLRLFQ